MLAKRRGFFNEGKEIIRTPLLLPSFSSKGFPEIQSILNATEEVIDGEILISAYDLHHHKLKGPFEFAEAIFLDSGGYEASIAEDITSLSKQEHIPDEWNLEAYIKVVTTWESNRPTVIISYDHPKERMDTVKQIERANKTLPHGKNIFREILIKPENNDSNMVNIKSIEKKIHLLSEFDAVGVTEKEIGINQQERMTNIARIRQALNSAGLENIPIHIFGSLDTISTQLYFVSGADIFDGLTWLRFAYYNGMTVYKHNYATLNFGTQIKSHLVDAHCSYTNYYYIKNMQLEMRNFLKNYDYECFSHHREIIKNSFKSVIEELEV